MNHSIFPVSDKPLLTSEYLYVRIYVDRCALCDDWRGELAQKLRRYCGLKLAIHCRKVGAGFFVGLPLAMLLFCTEHRRSEGFHSGRYRDRASGEVL